MSLTLELSPVQETELQAAAQREGLPINIYALRLIITALQQQTPVSATVLQDKTDQAYIDKTLDWETELKWAQEQAQKAFVASGKTDDEVTADVEAEVDAYRAEVYARTQAQTQQI